MVCRKLISRGLCMIFLEKTPPVSRICGMGHGLQKTAMISRGLCMIFFSKDTTSVTHLWHGPWFAENCHDITWPLHDFFSKDTTSVTHLWHGPWFAKNCHDITWPLHDFFSKDTTSVTHLLHGPWFALFFKRARLCLFLFLLRHSTCHMPCMFGFFTETCAEIMWPLHVGFSKDNTTTIMYMCHALLKTLLVSRGLCMMVLAKTFLLLSCTLAMVCRKLISRGLCMIFLAKTPPVSRICCMGHGLEKTVLVSRGLCMIFLAKTPPVSCTWAVVCLKSI